jgi:drug/metabolite transporter (DMT)-like permease
MFLRRFHSFALHLGWLAWPVLGYNQWPKFRFKERRGVTLEKHQLLVSTEKNEERRALEREQFEYPVERIHSSGMKFSKASFALGAAFLFGASTPAAKLLIADINPLMIAGLLYLGSGIGLTLWMLGRSLLKFSSFPALKFEKPNEKFYLSGAILFGGIVAPALLMIGLHKTSSATTSLLLNLESAFTVAVACLVFHEHYGKRLIFGFILLLAGGSFLALSDHDGFGGDWIGLLAIAGACAGWAIDNNLTKQVGSLDATLLAALKGIVAGVVNVGLALSLGQKLPLSLYVTGAACIGFVGYGLSLVLFIFSLRKIGAARTSAYFATAPFVGAALSILLLHEAFGWPLAVAGLLMAIGVYLHLTEIHAHAHTHEAMEHEHLHVHDEHHQHEHSPTDPSGEPHSHWHRHVPMTHSHPHDHDDLHHKHAH